MIDLFDNDDGASKSEARINLHEEHAREIAGMPKEWALYLFQTIAGSDNKVVAYRFRGSIAPLIVRGKRKGQKNWRKADKATEREVIITVADHKSWCLEWERKIGKCSKCVGKGNVFHSWDHKCGTTYKVCPECGGTGKPKESKQ